LLKFYNNRIADIAYERDKVPRGRVPGIQAWCADMWSLLWNAWQAGREVNVSSELAFCWPNDKLESWYNTKILHYAGVLPQHRPAAFWKGEYLNFSPIYSDFPDIDRQTCNAPLVELFKQCRKIKEENRIDLLDMTFLIPFFYDSDSRLDNLHIITRYLNRYFKTNIIIAEVGVEPKVDATTLPSCCRYIFLEDGSSMFHRTRVNNLLIQLAETDFISIYDTDIVLPIQQTVTSVNLLRSGAYSMVSPFDGELVSVDRLTKNAFFHILDPDLLQANKAKFELNGKRVCGGVININRRDYITAGMENEHFRSWGPEDIERIKRMKNLGFKVKRISGPIFHLPHERKENSGYADPMVAVTYIQEYLKICNMKQPVLVEYITSWPWVEENKLLTL
jgi:hypothetical protein